MFARVKNVSFAVKPGFRLETKNDLCTVYDDIGEKLLSGPQCSEFVKILETFKIVEMQSPVYVS